MREVVVERTDGLGSVAPVVSSSSHEPLPEWGEFVQTRLSNDYEKPPPMSISLSNPNEVDERKGSCVNASRLAAECAPVALPVSLLSSSTMPNAESESSGERESNVAKIGVDGGTNGLLFNDDDNDDGSCLTRFELSTAIAGEGLIGILWDKHCRSNS